MHGSVGAIFSQIYHRTDRDQFFHNWNRCTLPRVGFPTYSEVVFSASLIGVGLFKTFFKKKLL